MLGINLMWVKIHRSKSGRAHLSVSVEQKAGNDVG